MPLSDLEIKNLPYATGSQYVRWDFPCFGVRVSKKSKTFVIKQANRYHVIGRYPINSLRQCREEAKRRLALKYFPTASIKTRDAVELYLRATEHTLRAASHKLFATYLKHLALDTSLEQLTAQRLFEIITPLSPSAGNMAFSVFRAFLNWCVEQGHLTTNPLYKRKRPHKTKPKQRLLTDDEMRTIWRHTFAHGTAGQVLRSLILTGPRLNQIRSFQQTWIQEDAIVFPAWIMKGKEDHAIPLTPAIKKHLPTLDKPFNLDSHLLNKFRRPLNIPHFTPHHFRHYFSSTQAKLRTPIDCTEAILAHTTGSRTPIQRTYDRYDRIDPMRTALLAFEQHLVSLGLQI